MRRKLMAGLVLAGLGTALTACGDEDPTAVGSVLVGPSITTFEVVLDPAEFLQADTTFDSIGDLRQAFFRLAANQFAGELDAHTLFRIVRPFTVAYAPESGGATQTDSVVAIRGARVTLIVDSAASSPGPVEVEVRPILESWDQSTVTWTLRSDTAGTPEPWTTPGGTTGAPVGTGTWTGGDTLVITIDSASAAIWQDTIVARRGALIRPTTPGSRLRFSSPQFEFDVVPQENPDTVVTGGSAAQSMHIVSPDVTAPPQTELRVGGLPAWRTLLNFRSMRDLVLDACGSGGPGTGDPSCDVRLQDATLTLAEVLLTPVPVGGRRVERPVAIGGLQVLLTENVPPFRAPLGNLGSAPSDTVSPELFTPTPPAGAQVAIPVTAYIRQLVRPEDPERPASEWLALVAALERETFGYTAFASLESASPPRLRLVVTIPNQEIFE